MHPAALTPATCAVARRDLDTPLGTIVLARSDAGLVGCWFDDQKHRPPTIDAAAPRRGGDACLDDAEARLEDYFAGDPRGFDDVPLHFVGSGFQRSVWQLLCGIRHGETTTYGALARRLGQPQASRAVGIAVGRNPLGIVVPCHRVVGHDGSLTGYAGGLARKTALLKLEAAVLAAVAPRQALLALDDDAGEGGRSADRAARVPS